MGKFEKNKENGTRHIYASLNLRQKGGGMNKIIVLLCLSVLSLFFISCASQKKIVYVNPTQQKLTRPIIYSLDSSIYLCMQYTISKKSEFRSKIYYKRNVCSCYNTMIRLLELETTKTKSIGINTLIIWDTNFIINHILPLFKEEDERNIIAYTIANSNDSTFKDIIDYDNKVIISEKIYFYPIKIKTGISVMVIDEKWLKSVLPQSSWIYKPDCFDDGKRMLINLFIPLLEMDSVPHGAK